MKSVMNHRFSQTPDVKVGRSVFNRSHACKTTLDAGFLVPFLVDEILPGDTVKINTSIFARMATPLFPVMDNIYADTFFFAVPCRLLWENWKKFNGEQTDPGDSTDYTTPIIDKTTGELAVAGFTEMTLPDYFAIPTKVAGLDNISALPFRAYNMVYNEWFRDQNMHVSVYCPVDDGPDDCSEYAVLRRCKRHDYFTSCLPWPQKGDAVALPLGTSAPIYGIDQDTKVFNSTDTTERILTTFNAQSAVQQSTNPTATDSMRWSSDSDYIGLAVDLSNATGATINALRLAFQLQKLYERDARCGTRYIEVIRGHFGVVSPDMRQQRPEYLGGGRSYVNMHPIAQTESSDASTPQGTLAAIGTLSGTGHGFTKSFTEHCILLGLVCVTADLTYQQGLDRMWSRQTRWDYYWPALAHIGEQAVLNKEIYCDGSANDDLVFGYQEIYADMRYKPSRITGLFRSNATGSLDYCHLSQEFGSLPSLNSSFISEDPPIDRVIATPAEPHFIVDFWCDMRHVRPMPVHGTPGMIDHF